MSQIEKGPLDSIHSYGVASLVPLPSAYKPIYSRVTLLQRQDLKRRSSVTQSDSSKPTTDQFDITTSVVFYSHDICNPLSP